MQVGNFDADRLQGDYFVIHNESNAVELIGREVSVVVRRDDTDCPVCSDSTEPMDRVVTHCTHVFHEACLNEWLVRSNTCPTCRAVLPLPQAVRNRISVISRLSACCLRSCTVSCCISFYQCFFTVLFIVIIVKKATEIE